MGINLPFAPTVNCWYIADVPTDAWPNCVATAVGMTPPLVLVRPRKLPARSAAVGIKPVEVVKSVRQRGSYPKKKNDLFLPLYQCFPPSPNFGNTIGPPTVKDV